MKKAVDGAPVTRSAWAHHRLGDALLHLGVLHGFLQRFKPASINRRTAALRVIPNILA
jgi:hypothetical protein